METIITIIGLAFLGFVFIGGIIAFIAMNFYHAYIGDTVTRRSTYYAAILSWARICHNMRSKGQGGYIVLLPEWK